MIGRQTPSVRMLLQEDERKKRAMTSFVQNIWDATKEEIEIETERGLTGKA